MLLLSNLTKNQLTNCSNISYNKYYYHHVCKSIYKKNLSFHFLIFLVCITVFLVFCKQIFNSVCMCILQRPEKRIRSPVTGGCKQPDIGSGSQTPVPLQQQFTYLTVKPSLQSIFVFLRQGLIYPRRP